VKHLGPMEYFFKDKDNKSDDEEESSMPGDESSESENEMRVQRSATQAGCPFEVLAGTGNTSARTVKDSAKHGVDHALIINKLWSLGMSHEQLAKVRNRKERAVASRLSRWPPWRVKLYRLRRSVAFEAVTVFVIVMNTVCLIFIVSRVPTESRISLLGTVICKGVYVLETFIRILGNAKGRMSGWERLDTLLLLFGIVELGLMFEFMNNPTSTVGRAVPPLAVLQSLRMVRCLRLLKAKLEPLRVLLTALRSGLSHVASAGFFAGLVWLTAAICFTALLSQSSSDDPVVQGALDRFSSTGQSFLSALEMTMGGVCWSTMIFDPLMDSGQTRVQLGGVAIMLLVILSSFLIWNLVLGVYVRQITLIYKSVEEEHRHEVLLGGELNLKELRTAVEDLDADKDGFISRDELDDALTNKPEVLVLLRLSGKEVRVLHMMLDIERSNKVSISDFLFGVLKMAGASKTLDMLSIDYRQKALLRCIKQLEVSSARQLDALSADLDALYAYAAYLDERINSLHKSVSKAKNDLMTEIERLGRLIERARWQAQQNQLLADARRRQENLDVRAKIESQLDGLQVEINQVKKDQQFRYLTSGTGVDVMAIRKAVRERLDREVGPWLDRELDIIKTQR